jgi:AcrR family transcriptional regulator
MLSISGRQSNFAARTHLGTFLSVFPLDSRAREEYEYYSVMRITHPKAVSGTHPAAQEPGRRERRRNETRERIYRAAVKLFAERGFFETTTEQITEAADVGQGTFFNYFPSKQHVLGVLAEIQLHKINTARQRAVDEGEPAGEVLHALIHEITAEPGQSQALARALFSAILSNETVLKLVGETFSQGRREIAKIMAAAQRRGEIPRDRKPAELALAFQRAMVGTVLLWAVQPRANLKSWLELAFRDFWAAAAATKGTKQGTKRGTNQ